MIDISASYHYEPDYEDVLAMPSLPTCRDPEYSTIMRNYRFAVRLQRMLNEVDERIRADKPLTRLIRKRHRDLFAYLRAVYPTFGDPGAEVHERIYRDVLKRGGADDSAKR